MGLTYREAGVDIDAADRLIDRIKPLAASTAIPGVLGALGGFAGAFAVPPGMVEPVLVSGTDGVGTKLRVAFAAERHDSVGVDLVAMCVNDIVTVGARPLFFLDYFATGELSVEVAEAVISGVAAGCRDAGCALLGGETAELPGSYPAGEYDLAGFTVGVVERARMLHAEATRPGDVLLGLAASGLHANGFSLARAALLDRAGRALSDEPSELGGRTLGEALLEPTRIYVRAALAAHETGGVRAMCHVTGGGLPGNLPRVIADELGAEITNAPETPALTRLIASDGGVGLAELRRTFNMGVGFVLVVAPERLDDVAGALEAAGEAPLELGRLIASDAGGDARVAYPS